ncbi:hypothetical protein E2542_SST14444 [Spatholobus suberectus]|nr:hypothetical protein E2542_SST14444 [Spatholobus suberectus]
MDCGSDALLYPGALTKEIYYQKTIPSYKNVLKLYNFNTRAVSATSDLQHLEILVGSYLSVGGAITVINQVKTQAQHA